MKFTSTKLPGCFVVELEPHHDERGFFARTFCVEEFQRHGLDVQVAQCSLSFSREAGTTRGLHFQARPCTETKLVRCVRGAFYDVVVDLRRDSPTFLKWFAVELSAANRRSLYVPAGLAHGIQTLVPDTELLYQMNTPYRAEASRGIRWDDPDLAIPWPLPLQRISERDRTLPAISALPSSELF